MDNPYQAPAAELVENPNELVYIGFWMRVLATIIDSIITILSTFPILYLIYGAGYFESEEMIQGPLDFFFSYAFPLIWTISFWTYRQATPGKMIIDAKIVDAKTGGKPTSGQFVGRYFAYFLSALPLGLGYLWAAWDPKKQTWHDKLAGTLVVHS